jgi:5'-deoxynucleotidase YfbR-like HD superfamily hydrolase
MDQGQVADLWFKDIRPGMSVKRLHTVPTIKEHTVGHHSCGVALLTTLLCHTKKRNYWVSRNHIPSANVLIWALHHDLAEYHTGDVPAPVKWANNLISLGLEEIERGVLERLLGPTHYLDEEELLVVKQADSLDLLTACYEEIMLGNQNIIVVADNIYQHYIGKYRAEETENEIGTHLAQICYSKILRQWNKQ